MSGEKSNFEFLEAYDRRLAALARQAETYVYTDPESALFKLRLSIETLARTLLEGHPDDAATADLGKMLATLQREGVLPRREADNMHAIRRDGNAAIHGGVTPAPTALRRLRDLHGICAWYCRRHRRRPEIGIRKFTPPPPEHTYRRKSLERAERLEDDIERRRHETREALMLFGTNGDTEQESQRLRRELEALHRVAAAAGEPPVDVDSVVLIMAMEIERLLEHPQLGLTSREAKAEAERQLEAVKQQLDDHERQFQAERAALEGTPQGMALRSRSV